MKAFNHKGTLELTHDSLHTLVQPEWVQHDSQEASNDNDNNNNEMIVYLRLR